MQPVNFINKIEIYMKTESDYLKYQPATGELYKQNKNIYRKQNQIT